MARKKLQPPPGTPELMRAMGHPVRVDVLRLMLNPPEGRTDWSPSELADELALPLPNVAYHIRLLLQYRIVRQTRTRPRRGAIEHWYAFQRPSVRKAVAELFDVTGVAA